jgi:hypothetical protein
MSLIPRRQMLQAAAALGQTRYFPAARLRRLVPSGSGA